MRNIYQPSSEAVLETLREPPKGFAAPNAVQADVLRVNIQHAETRLAAMPDKFCALAQYLKQDIRSMKYTLSKL